MEILRADELYRGVEHDPVSTCKGRGRRNKTQKEMSFFNKELEFKGNRTLSGVLQDFGNDVQQALRDNLKDKQKGFSGDALWQSILFDVDLDGGVYRFELKLNEYYKFIDEGVSGNAGVRKSDSKFGSKPKAGEFFHDKGQGSQFKFKKGPPIDPLRLFASIQGLNVYALREGIFQHGIQANHFYSEIITAETINDLIKDISKAYKKAIEIELVDIFKGELNGK